MSFLRVFFSFCEVYFKKMTVTNYLLHVVFFGSIGTNDMMASLRIIFVVWLLLQK